MTKESLRGILLPALLTALAGTARAQSTSVELYGMVDAGLEVSRSGTGTLKRVVPGGMAANRWGVRGVEDLGGGWSAVFRLEGGFAIDDGTLQQGGRIFGRDASVGLSSRTWGTITAGRIPTPYFQAQNAVDAFYWAGSGGLIALTRGGSATRQVLPSVINARNDNALNYISPSFGDVEVRGLVSAGEGSSSIGRGFSASARYRADGLDLVTAWSRQTGAGNANGSVDALVLGGSFTLGSHRLYAGLTREMNSCSTCTGALARISGVSGTREAKFQLLNVGWRYQMSTQVGLIAQYVRVQDRSDYTVSPGSRDANWLAIGGEYALSKRTTMYATLGTIDNRNGSAYLLGSSAAQQPANAIGPSDPRASTLVTGIRHVF